MEIILNRVDTYQIFTVLIVLIKYFPEFHMRITSSIEINSLSSESNITSKRLPNILPTALSLEWNARTVNSLLL